MGEASRATVRFEIADLPDRPWQDMREDPRDQTVIEGKLPSGKIVRMKWAEGGDWASEFDKRRPGGFGGWLMLNDASQPLMWRVCGQKSHDAPTTDIHERIRELQNWPNWKPGRYPPLRNETDLMRIVGVKLNNQKVGDGFR